jgi:hypothetical protein
VTREAVRRRTFQVDRAASSERSVSRSEDVCSVRAILENAGAIFPRALREATTMFVELPVESGRSAGEGTPKALQLDGLEDRGFAMEGIRSISVGL